MGALIALRNSDAEGLGAKADHKTEHGQAAIPGLGECDETEAGRGISHECFEMLQDMNCFGKVLGFGCVAAVQEVRVKGARLPAQPDPQSWGAIAALPVETPARPERH